MQIMAPKLDTLEELFKEELSDIYSAEKMVLDSLPKMINAASTDELKRSFRNHLEETREQITRIEEVFDMLNIKPEHVKCDGMEGIIKDGEKIIKAHGDPNVKDAGLIAAAQKVEHYEITSYGTLRTFANTLGYKDVASKLQETLKQESKTDELLTQIAERSINVAAPKS